MCTNNTVTLVNVELVLNKILTITIKINPLIKNTLNLNTLDCRFYLSNMPMSQSSGSIPSALHIINN